jgi:hypothetical protein
VNTEETLRARLESWWSEYYSRPLKDPILQEYTTEELVYEYHDKVERRRVELESTEQDNDKIEEDRLKSNLDWAEKEEMKELEKNQSEEDVEKEEDKKWMEEQLKKEKEQFGEDYGEDVEIDF